MNMCDNISSNICSLFSEDGEDYCTMEDDNLGLFSNIGLGLATDLELFGTSEEEESVELGKVSLQPNFSSTINTAKKSLPQRRGSKKVCANNQTDDQPNSSLIPPKTERNGLSKNAIAAKENRIRKKTHYQNLEKSNTNMKVTIEELKKLNQEQEMKIESLTEKVLYLRSVIDNVDGLSALVESVRETSGIKYVGSTSRRAAAVKRKQSISSSGTSDDDCNVCKKRRFDCLSDEDLESRQSSDSDVAGICLHVSGEHLSVKFCRFCCTKASAASSMKGSDDDSSE